MAQSIGRAALNASCVAVLSCITRWSFKASADARDCLEIALGEEEAQGAEYLQLATVLSSEKAVLESRLEDAINKLSESSVELVDTKALLKKNQHEHEVPCVPYCFCLSVLARWHRLSWKVLLLLSGQKQSS